MKTDSTNSIGHLQLFIRDEAVRKGLIPAGHYGIPESDEKVIDLGVSVDVMPLARRPKAIDMTNMEALVISYDMESEEFKRIAAQAAESGLRCQYGPAFLVFERSTGRFLEFFCGIKSSRVEAKKLFPLLPLTQADIDAKAAAGNDVRGLKPHGPIPATLKVEVAENRRGTWHIPVVAKCSSTFARQPDTNVVAERIAEFLTIGKESLLARMLQEENRTAKQRPKRKTKILSSPAKKEPGPITGLGQATAETGGRLREERDDDATTKKEQESKVAKAKSRGKMPRTDTGKSHQGLGNDGGQNASGDSVRELLAEIDSILDHLQGVRERVSRLVESSED